MNNVILIGRLVADPELRYAAQSGRAVANFRLAVNRRFQKDKADFFRVTVWGNQAEAVSKYLKKGSQCAVEGSVQIDKYQDKNGSNRESIVVNANFVEFLDSKQDRKERDFPQVDDEEIPF
jgi:single-strand DNA-binding protein